MQTVQCTNDICFIEARRKRGSLRCQFDCAMLGLSPTFQQHYARHVVQSSLSKSARWRLGYTSFECTNASCGLTMSIVIWTVDTTFAAYGSSLDLCRRRCTVALWQTSHVNGRLTVQRSPRPSQRYDSGYTHGAVSYIRLGSVVGDKNETRKKEILLPLSLEDRYQSRLH